MPELPEAETIRRQLETEILGRGITAVTVHRRSQVRRHADPQEFVGLVTGRRIGAVGRRGKAVILTLDGVTVVVHLGMTGQLVVTPGNAPEDVHTRITFELDDGRQLRFIDQRTFGDAAAYAETVWQRIPDLAKYGPEPLSPAFNIDYLRRVLPRRGTRIQMALMDQKLVAGIGKIYADEITHAAGLHPERRANTLTETEMRRLVRATKRILRLAIGNGGTSAADEKYVDAYGRYGGFQLLLRTYQRTGEPCLRCGRPIQRMPMDGRSAHFCPRCQR